MNVSDLTGRCATVIVRLLSVILSCNSCNKGRSTTRRDGTLSNMFRVSWQVLIKFGIIAMYKFNYI